MNTSATPTVALWVSNVSSDCKDQLLRTAFGCFGTITTCQVFPNRSLAYLVFTTVPSAVAAKHALHGKQLGGSALAIEFAEAPHTAPAAPAVNGAHATIPATGYGAVPVATMGPGPRGVPPPAVGPAAQLPVPTEPPEDPFAKMVIDKFAEAFLRHGPYIQDLARLHHSHHPHIQFLSGPSRPGNRYYQWKIHCLRSGINDEQSAQAIKLHKMVSQRPPAGGPDFPLAHVQGPDYFKTMDQSDGLNCIECVETLNMVSALSESRESIKTASSWIISLEEKSRYGIHVFEQSMYDPVFAAAPEKKLLLVFVLSDIIHVCGKRATKQETVAFDAVRVFMPRFVVTALAYQPLTAVEKIGKIVNLWDTKGAFDEDILKALKTAVEQTKVGIQKQESEKQAWEQYYQSQAPAGGAVTAAAPAVGTLQPGPPVMAAPAYAGFAPETHAHQVPPPYAAPLAHVQEPVPQVFPPQPMPPVAAPSRPEPPVGRVEEWLSAGYFNGLQRSVESPYTPLNPALAPKVNLPPVTQNVMALPRRVRDALEDFYKELYPGHGVDSAANMRDFYLEKGTSPVASADPNATEGFKVPKAAVAAGVPNGI